MWGSALRVASQAISTLSGFRMHSRADSAFAIVWLLALGLALFSLLYWLLVFGLEMKFWCLH